MWTKFLILTDTFNVVTFSGELSLKELAILGSKYGEGEISIKQGEAITWSRPKQDVKNILQQLWTESLVTQALMGLSWETPEQNQKRDEIPSLRRALLLGSVNET